MAIRKEMFDEVELNSSQREMLELTKLPEDELYRTIGMTARETRDTMKPGEEFLKSPNIGDTTGKSAFFFRNPKIESDKPALYGGLPDDPIEAGKMVCGQLSGFLDKVICETVTHSNMYDYKQERIRLAARCVEMIADKYPTIDPKIDKAYVALRAKEGFDKCSLF